MRVMGVSASFKRIIFIDDGDVKNNWNSCHYMVSRIQPGELFFGVHSIASATGPFKYYISVCWEGGGSELKYCRCEVGSGEGN